MLVTLSGSNLTDASGVITRRIQNKVTIANAVAITDTANHEYNLITQGGLTEDQIRRYSDFKISIKSTCDQAANVVVYTAMAAHNVTTATTSGQLYSETSNLPANPGGFLIMQSGVNATGAGTTSKSVPALKSVHSNLIIRVTFPVAPTTGSVTITVEMNG